MVTPLQTTPSPEVITWLLDQSPMIATLGIIIWWLAKKLAKVEAEKDEISKEVIKLATLWEKKTEQSEDDDDLLKQQILKALEDIKEKLNNRRSNGMD